MIPITKEKFKELAEIKHYLKPRWEYSKAVINYVRESNFVTGLEIGPRFLPLFDDSDILDIQQSKLCRPVNFLWDCDNIPWPIEDKKYDVVIALQVLEHLRHPAKVFREIKRISNNTILSVPYMWTRSARAGGSHMGINMRTIKRWTEMKPNHYEVINSKCETSVRPRIVCCYSFERTR